MRLLFLCAALAAAYAAGTVEHPRALAQGSKKEVKKDSKSPVIEIAEGKDGKFRFFVRDGEGKLLAMSSPGGYASEKEARTAIDALKKAIGTAKVTVKKGDKKEKDGK
jgi:uncharacterized protein YegP (UPF0339 family)